MKQLSEILGAFAKPIFVLDPDIPIDTYVSLDLSTANIELDRYDLSNPNTCQSYIDTVLKTKNSKVAYGGYLEKRGLYDSVASFSNNKLQRNIHLGIDFWAAAGTKIVVPLRGKIHSFKNNANQGDYGPTIILEHILEDHTFYSLYGHLSIASIEGLYVGKEYNSGDVLATLGTSDINVNYAPHLHFQLIMNLEGCYGDYPGVASNDTLDFYKENCPDPNLLLGIHS